VLTCRTVSFDQYKRLFHNQEVPVFLLAGLHERQRDAYIERFPTEAGDCYDPKA